MIEAFISVPSYFEKILYTILLQESLRLAARCMSVI